MTQVEYKITDKINQERINEILKVEETNGLTPENLIAIASNKKNPLHDLFEWDDTEAARLYRLQQARMIINEVKVIIEEKEYYAFENVQVTASHSGSEEELVTERVYKPIVEIMSNEDLRKQIIASALRQHEYWEKQNEKYSELAPIIKSARKIREKWQKNKQ